MECINSILPKRTGTTLENEGGGGAKCGAKFTDTPFIRIDIAPAV
jgi:hypothetical protein